MTFGNFLNRFIKFTVQFLSSSFVKKWIKIPNQS